jgi:hypothetical protein
MANELTADEIRKLLKLVANAACDLSILEPMCCFCRITFEAAFGQIRSRSSTA